MRVWGCGDVAGWLIHKVQGEVHIVDYVAPGKGEGAGAGLSTNGARFGMCCW